MSTNKIDWNDYKKLLGRVFLIFLIPALIFFWGSAIISNFTNFWNVFTPENKEIFSKDLVDEVPVLAPTLSQLPKAVKDPRLSVRGFSQSGMQVQIFLNGAQAANVRADKTGQFSFDGLELSEGDNEIYAKTVDSRKVESPPSAKVIIKYLKKSPFLELTNLGDNTEIRQSTNIFTITGKTESGATVTLNGSLVFVDNDGNFNYQYSLPDGQSQITAIAADPAGNQTTITRNVTFTKQ